jgi:hypothetical protein
MGGQIKGIEQSSIFLCHPLKEPCFLKSIDASSHVRNANPIDSMLGSWGKMCCPKLCGNWKMLCEKDPTNFWTPCIVHYINLILEDIVKLDWVHAIVHE